MNTARLSAASTLSRSIAPSILMLVCLVLLCSVPASAYPKVKITNLTKWVASGEVDYAACKNDKFSGLQPGGTWIGPYRGACLIRWVSANLSGGPGVNQYTSSGTGYSEFFISPSGSAYQVFSSHEDPTVNRAPPEVVNKPFFNIAHMVNTDTAVDWALSQGANGLEMDMLFNSDGQPSKFRHGDTIGASCDCTCWMSASDHVCGQLAPLFCLANSPLEDHLRHIADKSSQVAMIVIDSKVDDLSQSAQTAAGAAVVKLLEQHLFSNGYKGFAVVSAPEWKYSAYLLAAVGQAKTSPYRKQFYFGVDMDNGGTEGATNTLSHLLNKLGSPKVVYGSGISSCAGGIAFTYYEETMLAVMNEARGFVRLVDIWTIDKEESMKKYILLGANGILTNRPAVLARVAKEQGKTLAQPGYLP